MEMRPNRFDIAPDRKVLSISTAPEDHDSLRLILHGPGWSITRAFSCQQAIARLCRNRMGVIVCDCHLSDGSWKDILSYVAELTEPAVVIVASRAAGEDLRAEVRALGGFDVLSKPFRAEEVNRVVIAAWQNRSVAIQEPSPA
jgi:DNA-binding response OmpR family regulator